MSDNATGTQNTHYRWLGILAPILIGIAVLVAYANVPGNAFALDDWHTIEQNRWIRSLGNVPKFFTDANTFSTLATNVDYRPVLQTSFAINHAMTGSVIDPDHTDSWHWTNILIHFGVSYCLFLVGRRLFGSFGLAPVPGLHPHIGDIAAFTAALVFAIHPVTAGAVNYISARSSSLTTLFVLVSLIFYLRGLARPHRWWRFVVSGVFFALGLFTKVEAISLFAAFVLAEVLLNPAVRSQPYIQRLVHWPMYKRLGPMLLVAVLYLIVWRLETRVADSETRAGSNVTGKDYLVTEVRAWWYYIAQVFVPTHLVADYPTYPPSWWRDFFKFKEGGFPQLVDARPVLALAGWAVVGLFAWLNARRNPVVTFLIICFFAYLAPHSSIIPLAEPVNEHRPYLAYSSVFLLMAIGLGMILTRLARKPVLVAAALFAALAVPLFAMTRERNTVWRDAESLWGDTVKKAPDATRAQMNYGLALMNRGSLTEAEARFREAIRLAPRYAWAHSNLAILLERKGDMEGALASHNAAVRSMETLDIPYYWRARFWASLHNPVGAAEDYQAAAKLGSAPFRELAGAAECLIRIGRASDAQVYIDRGHAADNSVGDADFEQERLWVRNLLGPEDSVAQATEGEKLRSAGKWLEAEWRFREAIRLDPKNVAAHINLGIALNGRGYPAVATQWFDAAVQLQPTSDAPFYWRGRFHASQKNWEGALADFQKARSLNGPAIQVTAALVETLLAAGRDQDAASELAALDAAGVQALAAERQDFRARVLKK